MNQPEQFAHHLRVFKELLQPGKAVLAWHVAYFLARHTPPVPTRDAPITIPMDERPPLVIAALRWISDRAAINPASPDDDHMRQRGWIEYFVRAEIAQSMLDEAGQHDDPWQAMPHIRALDAAVLVAGDQPQADVFHIEQLTPMQRAAAQRVAQQTGAVFPSKWEPRVEDGAEWISAAQFGDLMGAVAPPHQQPDMDKARIVPAPSRIQPRVEAIRTTALKLGMDLKNLKPYQPGGASDKAAIKKAAIQDHGAVFGAGEDSRSSAFDRTWEAMTKDGEIRNPSR